MEDYKNSKAGRIVAQKYADILYASRPETEASLRRHPRMSIENRAKIFSPFAALRGYEEKIAAEGLKLQRVNRQELPEEDAAALNEKLASLCKGMPVTVTYFVPDRNAPPESQIGIYQTICGTVETLDFAYKECRVAGKTVAFSDVLKINTESPAHQQENMFSAEIVK